MARFSLAIVLPVIAIVAMASFMTVEQEPWTPEQLMAPADLASVITQQKNIPLIISVGPAALIKGSVDIGPASEKANLEKLKTLLAKQDKHKQVVIYCGCCPFKNCPNVRPAFALLNEMKFTQPRLLDLAHNIKMDWLNQHYPVQDTK